MTLTEEKTPQKFMTLPRRTQYEEVIAYLKETPPQSPVDSPSGADVKHDSSLSTPTRAERKYDDSEDDIDDVPNTFILPITSTKSPCLAKSGGFNLSSSNSSSSSSSSPNSSSSPSQIITPEDPSLWRNSVPGPIDWKYFKGIKQKLKKSQNPQTFELAFNQSSRDKKTMVEQHLIKKDMLWYSVHSMALKHQEAEDFNFLPQTFVLPKQYNDFRKICKEQTQACPWIVKPHKNGYSTDISIINGFNEFKKLDSLKMSLQRRKMVVSKYINNPLLIDGYKFDLRFYVLVSSFNPLRVYFFNDGIARFCTERYQASSSSFDDPRVHITNASVNVKSSKAVFELLKEHDIDSDRLMKKIHDLTIKTLISVQTTIDEQTDSVNNRRHQLYGVDILVDDKLKPWLIDFNSNPCLEPFCHPPVKADMDIPTDLSEKEANDVICTLTENKNRGNFELIYPAPNFKKYEKYLTVPHSRVNSVIVDNIWPVPEEKPDATFFRMYSDPLPRVVSPVVKSGTIRRAPTFFRMYPIE